MPYEVLDSTQLIERSGLNFSVVGYQETLETALNNQKQERGMELVAIDTTHQMNPLYVFRHETD